jgi:hypothetical protein
MIEASEQISWTNVLKSETILVISICIDKFHTCSFEPSKKGQTFMKYETDHEFWTMVTFKMTYSQIHTRRGRQGSWCRSRCFHHATAACQGIWLARLLSDLKNTAIESVGLKLDNKSALSLIKNPVFHERSNHIQTRFHFIQESSESGEIRPDFISTGNQLANILTKALPRARFQELQAKIGMVLAGAQV